MAGSGRVDFQKEIIFGYVVAQVGEFKTPGRGKFDEAALAAMIRIWPTGGLKSRFTHPSIFSGDGLGKFLGRSRNPRIENRKLVADLHMDKTAYITPNGNLGAYIMQLAASDPDALSSSLVLDVKKIEELDERGRVKIGPNGEPTAPYWYPKKLFASDIVDTGDAVDGFLSKNPECKLDVLEKELGLLAVKGRFLAGDLSIDLPKTAPMPKPADKPTGLNWRHGGKKTIADHERDLEHKKIVWGM